MSMGELIRLQTGDVVPIQVNDGIELRVEDNQFSLLILARFRAGCGQPNQTI